jgi:hypothetical protein
MLVADRTPHPNRACSSRMGTRSGERLSAIWKAALKVAVDAIGSGRGIAAAIQGAVDESGAGVFAGKRLEPRAAGGQLAAADASDPERVSRTAHSCTSVRSGQIARARPETVLIIPSVGRDADPIGPEGIDRISVIRVRHGPTTLAPDRRGGSAVDGGPLRAALRAYAVARRQPIRPHGLDGSGGVCERGDWGPRSERGRLPGTDR